MTVGQPPEGAAALVASLQARIAELERADADRQRVAEDLAQANANLSALIENTSDFVLFSDRSGTPIFFNSAYAQVMKQLLGIEMRPGIKPHELLSDVDAKRAWDGYHRRVLSGEHFSIEYAHPLTEDNTRYFEVSFNPVRQAGEIIGFSEFTRDITARKEQEHALREANDRLEQLVSDRTKALRESERRFRVLTERSNDVTVIIARDGTLAYVSPSVRRWGYSPEEIIGRGLPDFIHPDDLPRVQTAIARAIEEPGQAVVRVPFRGKSGSGEYIHWEGTYTCLFDVEGVDGIVFNGRDVSERAELEERLRQAEKMDAIGQLAGGIAHDFNNQLTGILGNADLLSIDVADDKHRELAVEIRRAAERSADLTTKLLTFARKGPYRRASLDINEVIRGVASFLERSLEKNVEIRLELLPHELGLEGDASLLENALLNLALNARDAMPDGGPITLSSDVDQLTLEDVQRHGLSVPPGRYVRISVRDLGTGMDENTQRRMFEPFFTTKGPGRGTGMGLASVYGTVESHGGAIIATSALGAGTTFEIFLPASDSQPEEPARPSEPAPSAETCRVLVIDDEPGVRSALTNMLGFLGHSVETCTSAREGLESLRRAQESPSLIFLDMNMPEMSASDAFAALRAHDPDVPIVLISGHWPEHSVRDLLARGASGFVRKPFRLEAITDALRRARSRRPKAKSGS